MWELTEDGLDLLNKFKEDNYPLQALNYSILRQIQDNPNFTEREISVGISRDVGYNVPTSNIQVAMTGLEKRRIVQRI